MIMFRLSCDCAPLPLSNKIIMRIFFEIYESSISSESSYFGLQQKPCHTDTKKMHHHSYSPFPFPDSMCPRAVCQLRAAMKIKEKTVLRWKPQGKVLGI